MNTLYLHIGMHKTATTTIQHFLADNDEVLKTKGYTYPRFPFHYPYKGKDRNGLFFWTPYIDYDGVRHPEIEENNYKEGLQIIQDIFKTYPNVIVSNESLWFYLSKNGYVLLDQLLKDAEENNFRVKLILYLRRQDKFVESFWNEMIKSNIVETRKLDDFIKDYKRLRYGKYFSKMGDIIGDENLILRRFEEAVKGDGIIADFMHCIGLELTDEYTVREDKSNTQLYGNVTEIKRIINEMDSLKMGDVALLRDALWMASETSKKNYPCSELSEEEHAKFMEQFKEGNEMLAERFIGDGKPLFSDDYSVPPKREDDNPEFLKDVIRVSAACDVQLLRRIKEDEKTIRSLEKQIQKLEDALAKQSTRIDHLRHPVKTLLSKKK